MGKQTRIFWLFVLGLFALNPYAFGQVEDDAQINIPSESVNQAENSEGVNGNENSPVEIEETSTLRDPFWPVGYEPVPEEEAVEEDESEADEGEVDLGPVDFSGLTAEEQAIIKSQLNVGGILKQNETCMAIINNQLLKQGETLELTAGGRSYSFNVKALTPDRILLESLQ